MVAETVKRVEDGCYPAREDILYLLGLDRHGADAGYIMGLADHINRRASGGKAEVHAQIGLNLSPCPNNCSFCAFAANNRVFTGHNELRVEDAVRMALSAEKQGANALFLMGTADYPFAKFIEVSREIVSKLGTHIALIANVGDFDASQARTLKDTGYTGIYHAVRMGEGIETRIDPETRLNTIRAAQEAGLLIGTCVEPIGPEHTHEEIAEKILIGREMNPCYSGAMRRITIPGSSLEKHGMISEHHLAYLVAVVRLAMGKTLMANCTHEPNVLGATAGANLFWAEVGTNPRDTEAETSEGRGLDVFACKRMLREADWDVLEGPSAFYSPRNLVSHSKGTTAQA